MLGLGGGLAAKLLAVFDYVKVRSVGRQGAVLTVLLYHVLAGCSARGAAVEADLSAGGALPGAGARAGAAGQVPCVRYLVCSI